jgi:hypothetical protein
MEKKLHGFSPQANCTNGLSDHRLSASLCGLVVKVLDYRIRGPGSISSATRFLSEKLWVWNGVHSAS